MSRYIDADALQERMYNEVFDTDSDMQKWDSGCWIRYKLFEKVLRETPTADAVPVVRCEDDGVYMVNVIDDWYSPASESAER